MNDGCTGLAVMNPRTPREVQFDEHKLLIIYGESREEFEQVLGARSLQPREGLRFLTEAEHAHSSKEEYIRQFDELSAAWESTTNSPDRASRRSAAIQEFLDASVSAHRPDRVVPPPFSSRPNRTVPIASRAATVWLAPAAPVILAFLVFITLASRLVGTGSRPGPLPPRDFGR